MRPAAIRCALARSLFASVAPALIACSSLVDVDTPAAITNDHLDPARDGRVFSLSARQNFATAYGQLVLYGAWFTGEALSAETQPGVSEFERREVSSANGDLLHLWTRLSVARESAERVVTGLSGTAGANSNVDVARAALVAGYSYVMMAEDFCHGVASGGPLLDEDDLLQRATEYFTRAHDVAVAANSATTGSAGDRAESADIAAAALVGRARAHLQRGDPSRAIADAERVAPDFSMSLWYSDDPASIAQLSNTLWFHTTLRATLTVAPAFRQLGDPRVSVASPDPAFPPFDGITPLWTQRKYPSFAASIRLASGLEARYVAAEALGATAMLALIAERRQTNGQPSYAGPSDDVSVMRELMLQRSRDFFLEGKRLGDMRRHPGLVPDLPEPGTPYHKTGFPPIGDQSCWPLPDKETSRFAP